MSILTKISIVVLVLLNLLACPVFINQATVIPNYRDQAREAQARERAMAHTAYGQTLMVEQRNERLGRQALEVARLESQLAGREEQIARLESDHATAIAELRLRLERYEDTIVTDLTSLRTQSAGRLENLEQRLAVAQAEIERLRGDNIRLQSDLQEQDARAQRAEEIAEVLRIERVRLVQEMADMRRSIGTGGTVAGTGTMASGGVAEGRVLTVRGNLASVNIGENSGIVSGQRLMIWRDGRLVAHLVIEEVFPNESAGIIVDRQLDPQPGDRVMTVEPIPGVDQ